ncbi:MAG: nitroreductase family protein [Polyangiaceae bacterium]
MTRVAEAPIDPIFLRRWSPRAMSGAPITRDEINALLEAARWAPSAANFQPWRFVVALRDTPAFDKFFDLLADGNKTWCQRAGALVLVTSYTLTDKGQPLRTHAFDTGAAWVSFALQGSMMGLVVHGMGGFDYDRARDVVKLPAGHEVHAMVAVGHPGNVDDLAEHLRPREVPNARKHVTEFAFDGEFSEAPKSELAFAPKRSVQRASRHAELTRGFTQVAARGVDRFEHRLA